jgi:hypothetical protein
MIDFFFKENLVENCFEISRRDLKSTYKLSRLTILNETDRLGRQLTHWELWKLALEQSQVVPYEEIKEEIKCDIERLIE